MNKKNYIIIFIILCSFSSVALFGMQNDQNQQQQNNQQNQNQAQDNPQPQPQQPINYTVKSKYAFPPNAAVPAELTNLWAVEADAIKTKNNLSTRVIDNATNGVSSGFGQGIGTGIGTSIVEFNKPFITISHNFILGTSGYKKQLEKLSIEKRSIHEDITMLLSKTRAATEEILLLRQQQTGASKETAERLKKLFDQKTQYSIEHEELKKRELANQNQLEKLNKEYQPTQPLYNRLTGWMRSKFFNPQSKKPQPNKNAQKPTGTKQPTQPLQPVKTPQVPKPQENGPLKPNPNIVPKPQPNNNKK